MRNKKGFIATSVLYSFFLVFLTMFLGIIYEYMNNKNNLSYIEASIKRELNNTLSINDFRVNDNIYFTTNISSGISCYNATFRNSSYQVSGESIECSNITSSSIEKIDGNTLYVKSNDERNNYYAITFNDGVKVTKSINKYGVIAITGVAS